LRRNKFTQQHHTTGKFHRADEGSSFELTQNGPENAFPTILTSQMEQKPETLTYQNPGKDLDEQFYTGSSEVVCSATA
jgi:hypothetical protein